MSCRTARARRSRQAKETAWRSHPFTTGIFFHYPEHLGAHALPCPPPASGVLRFTPDTHPIPAGALHKVSAEQTITGCGGRPSDI